MFGHIHKISQEITVVSHSPNYTVSYEIYVGKHGLYHLIKYVVLSCWNVNYISPRVLWRARDTIFPHDRDEAHYILRYFASI